MFGLGRGRHRKFKLGQETDHETRMEEEHNIEIGTEKRHWSLGIRTELKFK